MTCVICKNGETQRGLATVTLTRGETTVVVKGVPAEVCDVCGEYYLDADTAEKLESRIDDAVAHGAEVEILKFVA